MKINKIIALILSLISMKCANTINLPGGSFNPDNNKLTFRGEEYKVDISDKNVHELENSTKQKWYNFLDFEHVSFKIKYKSLESMTIELFVASFQKGQCPPNPLKLLGSMSPTGESKFIDKDFNSYPNNIGVVPIFIYREIEFNDIRMYFDDYQMLMHNYGVEDMIRYYYGVEDMIRYCIDAYMLNRLYCNQDSYKQIIQTNSFRSIAKEHYPGIVRPFDIDIIEELFRIYLEKQYTHLAHQVCSKQLESDKQTLESLIYEQDKCVKELFIKHGIIIKNQYGTIENDDSQAYLECILTMFCLAFRDKWALRDAWALTNQLTPERMRTIDELNRDGIVTGILNTFTIILSIAFLIDIRRLSLISLFMDCTLMILIILFITMYLIQYIYPDHQDPYAWYKIYVLVPFLCLAYFWLVRCPGFFSICLNICILISILYKFIKLNIKLYTHYDERIYLLSKKRFNDQLRYLFNELLNPIIHILNNYNYKYLLLCSILFLWIFCYIPIIVKIIFCSLFLYLLTLASVYPWPTINRKLYFVLLGILYLITLYFGNDLAFIAIQTPLYRIYYELAGIPPIQYSDLLY